MTRPSSRSGHTTVLSECEPIVFVELALFGREERQDGAERIDAEVFAFG